MIIQFDDSNRVLRGRPEIPAARHVFEWRYKRGGDAVYGAWQGRVEQESPDIVFSAHNASGVYQVRVRGQFPDGSLYDEWDESNEVVVGSLPVAINVPVGDDGCPDLRGKAMGDVVYWVNGGELQEGVKTSPWYETAVGVDDGVAFLKSGVVLGRDPSVALDPPLWMSLRSGVGDTSALIEDWAYRTQTGGPGQAVALRFGDTWFLDEVGDAVIENPVVAVRGRGYPRAGVVAAISPLNRVVRQSNRMRLWQVVRVNKDWFPAVPAGSIMRFVDIVFAVGSGGVQMADPNDVAKVNFRLGGGTLRTSENLRGDISKYRVLLRFGTTVYSLPFRAGDEVEPYSLPTSGWPAGLLGALEALRASSSAVAPDIAVVYLPELRVGVDKVWDVGDEEVWFYDDDRYVNKGEAVPSPTEDQLEWLRKSVVGGGYTVGVLDGSRRCPDNPLLDVSVRPNVAVKDRLNERLFTYASSVGAGAVTESRDEVWSMSGTKYVSGEASAEGQWSFLNAESGVDFSDNHWDSDIEDADSFVCWPSAAEAKTVKDIQTGDRLLVSQGRGNTSGEWRVSRVVRSGGKVTIELDHNVVFSGDGNTINTTAATSVRVERVVRNVSPGVVHPLDGWLYKQGVGKTLGDNVYSDDPNALESTALKPLLLEFYRVVTGAEIEGGLVPVDKWKGPIVASGGESFVPLQAYRRTATAEAPSVLPTESSPFVGPTVAEPYVWRSDKVTAAGAWSGWQRAASIALLVSMGAMEPVKSIGGEREVPISVEVWPS